MHNVVQHTNHLPSPILLLEHAAQGATFINAAQKAKQPPRNNQQWEQAVCATVTYMCRCSANLHSSTQSHQMGDIGPLVLELLTLQPQLPALFCPPPTAAAYLRAPQTLSALGLSTVTAVGSKDRGQR